MINTRTNSNKSNREQELQLALLKVLDGMVEKVADELPRRAGRGEDDDLPALDEQKVVTSSCCSFFVRELGQLYNKDFSRLSREAHAAHEELHATHETLRNAALASDADAQAAQRALREEAAQNATKEAPAGSINTAKPVSISTTLNSSEFELIYFMLRVLGHTTSLVEECDSARLSRNGNDLRTNLGNEGLLALVVGMQ